MSSRSCCLKFGEECHIILKMSEELWYQWIALRESFDLIAAIEDTPVPPDLVPVVPAPGGAGAGRGASGGVAGDAERGTGGGGAGGGFVAPVALAGPPVRTSSERWNQKNAEAGVKSLPSEGESFRSSRRKSRSSGRPSKTRKPREPSGVPDSKIADASSSDRGEVTQSAYLCDSSDESYGSKSCRTAVVGPASIFALSALSGSDRDGLIDFVVDTVATSHLCTSIEYLSDVILLRVYCLCGRREDAQSDRYGQLLLQCR